MNAYTSATYTCVGADVGHGIACEVTVTNASGVESKTSNVL